MEQFGSGLLRGEGQSWLVIALLSTIVLLLMTLVELTQHQRIILIEREHGDNAGA